ncbi:glycosyltransferase family 4 protein [Pedobacter immunditicola]|uniref:glycosyltransferase family 4 protein n=1 Tax=Pedobacter immunditicola TaxID=3133440 RepID=UPI0030A6C827
MHKIKIVHVIGTLSRGGAERFVIDLCNEIAKIEKYEVYILSLSGNDPQNTFINDLSNRVNYISFNKKSGLSLSVLVKLTNWLKVKTPHIVHSHLNAFEYLALYRAFKSRTTFFHTIHNTASFECPNLVIKNIRAFFYRNNKVIPVTISMNGSKTYREYYNLNNDVIVENGRPTLSTTAEFRRLHEKYKGADNRFLLVNIGRISQEKNQEMLIESVKKFNETESIKCKLLIIGDIKDEQLSIKLRSRALNDANIEILGGKNNIADYLSIADAFCLSSIYEGMPISLIEAMSVGCIPVCTPVGGIKEMIKDGVTGFISKNTTLESFYQALKRAVYSKEKDVIKDNILKAYNNRYHIEISAKNHLKTYNKALNLFEGRDSAFELLYKSKVN